VVPDKPTSENIPIHKLYEINITLRLSVLMTSRRVQASTNKVTSNFGIIITVGVSVTVHHIYIYISKEIYQLDGNNFTMILFS